MTTLPVVARLCWALATGLLVLLPASAFAQGTIAGQVKDSSGAVLPGVTVEATSPVLIEKARSVVTDGSGLYRIVDLRPGIYTVTFTLQGFTTIRREGIELTGNFTATVHAELPVGTLEEAVTVSGEAPIVDVSSATRQRVLREEMIDALPNDRVPAFMAALSPGINMSTQDVGGSMGNTASGSNMTSHGSRTTDIRTLASGLSVQSLETGSSAQGVPNMMMYQEVTIDSSGSSAENDLGGVTINLIPKEGGNQLRGSFITSFANNALQDSNFTQDLRDRGLATANEIKTIVDVNAGLGGPIKRDKLWFFVTGRYTAANNYVGGMFWNANTGNPNAFTYVADTSRPAFTENIWKTFDMRVTWQASKKHKLAFGFDQTESSNPAGISASVAPESAPRGRFHNDLAFRGEWTAPVTDRVLLEAVLYQRRLPSYTPYPDGVEQLGLSGITEQATGVTFRGVPNGDSFKINSNVAYRAAISYVTGTHAFKFGFTDGQGSRKETVLALDSPISFRVNGGIPNQLTQIYSPDIRCDDSSGCDEYQNYSDLDHDLGLFAQDKWQLSRLSLSYGLRFSWFKTSFPVQQFTPSALAPNLDLTIPETAGVNWKDVTPRFGAVYDVFGKGKTAVKVSLNKYVNGQALTGNAGGGTTVFGSQLNPFNRVVLSTTRSWTDRDGDFVPDCNLTATGTSDECGPMTNQNFGKSVIATQYDQDVLSGWGKRGYNWEFAGGVQHEILPQTSLEVTYFRRWYGNFVVTDNRSVAASDYTQYQITAPTSDSRLPNAGEPVTGLFDLVQDKVGQVDNYLTFAENFGKQKEHWNGVDIAVNSRVKGVQLMGGMSTGRTSVDFCDVVDELPEMQFGLRTLNRTNAASVLVPAQYCNMQEAFRTQVKFIGSYLIPKIGVQVGGSFQNLPGPQVAANYVANNAVTSPSLGRPLSGGANNVTISILEPGSVYGERVNQLDLRISKQVRLGASRRANFSLDIANVLNNNAVLTENVVFTAWRQPQTILLARFVKFGLQLDF